MSFDCGPAFTFSRCKEDFRKPSCSVAGCCYKTENTCVLLYRQWQDRMVIETIWTATRPRLLIFIKIAALSYARPNFFHLWFNKSITVKQPDRLHFGELLIYELCHVSECNYFQIKSCQKCKYKTKQIFWW